MVGTCESCGASIFLDPAYCRVCGWRRFVNEARGSDWADACGTDAFGSWADVHLRGASIRFRFCRAGSFSMGSALTEAGAYLLEQPQHVVALSKGFWIADSPVTQSQWSAFGEDVPFAFVGRSLPVESVSWEDCLSWIENANRFRVGLRFRLPTEAEWEYACRAGTTTVRYMPGPRTSVLGEIAWYRGNSGSTNPVKSKACNPWGLYDTLGNVWEWCGDNRRRYSAAAVNDPWGGTGGMRVIRGAGWRSGPHVVRAAARSRKDLSYRSSDVGFRLVQEAPPPR
jgi:formylglycine-generating enzyme required for sulfatase activity